MGGSSIFLVDANADTLKFPTLYKKSYKGNMFSHDLKAKDIKSGAGYSCEVIGKDEKEQEDLDTIRGSGRNHRRQIVQGLFRASGMVIYHHRAFHKPNRRSAIASVVILPEQGSFLASAKAIATHLDYEKTFKKNSTQSCLPDASYPLRIALPPTRPSLPLYFRMQRASYLRQTIAHPACTCSPVIEGHGERAKTNYSASLQNL
jgi:hypothetical protein